MQPLSIQRRRRRAMNQDWTHSKPDEAKTVRIQVEPQAVHAGRRPPRGPAEESESLSSQYDILGRIGSGGMGVVYLARDRRLGRCVAIKRLHPAGLDASIAKDRFLLEARAVASLNHIHIVHIYALGEDKEGPFIVMEYVAGPKPSEQEDEPAPAMTLADRVRREGPLPLDGALDLLIKLCRAVEYAHANHVIHRDLKPTNVLIDESGEPKIADFGLARMRSRDSEPLTLPGAQMLSLGYGAPEQESDASLADERADVYGLGALLYFCITGDNPRYFRPHDLPEVLRMSIVKALETNRDQRWSSVTEFRETLALTRSPSDTTLSTAKTTWRCKWCDTLNPVAIRYCGKCGWDGGIFCTECSSESRFGVQYCGVCGADAKAYENANSIFGLMSEHMKRRDFALVEQQESHIKGFRPQGAHGRDLIDRVRQLVDEAATARRRRDTLRREIMREFDAGAYKQAAAYIKEYNTLAFDDAFAELEPRLAPLQIEKDMDHLRTAVRDKQWRYARSLAETLRVGCDNPEVDKLLARIVRRLRTKRVIWSAGIVVVGVLLYLVSGVPAYRLMHPPEGGAFDTFYRPLRWMHDETLFRYPLDLYARVCDAGDLFER